MELTNEELNLVRQWFNAVDDLNPKYLEQPDRDLGRKILKRLLADDYCGEAPDRETRPIIGPDGELHFYTGPRPETA